jgi:primosomal protein N'
MVQLTVTADSESELNRVSKKLSDSIIEKLSGEFGKLPFMVFGPFEAQVYKLNEKYRMRMVVKCKLNKQSRELFKALLCEFAAERDATLAVDLNPLSI